MTMRSELVSRARHYLGTPFLHQGRDSSGLDCVGLLIRVAHDLELTDFDFREYQARPDGETMQRLLDEHLDRLDSVSDAQPGDVLAMRYRAPQHAAIITTIDQDGEFTVIHATERGVAEHRLDSLWMRKVYGAYRVRGIE